MDSVTDAVLSTSRLSYGSKAANKYGMEQVAYQLPGAVATYAAKSALFTAAATDRGTFYDSTGSFTITLDTTGMVAGWSAWFRCVSGTQTLDPSGGTLINGATTYAVSNAGDVVLVEYTGSAFVIAHTQRPATVAITGGTINGTTIGATTATTGRFTTIESTIATGTAPLIVASTTVVTNLNASLLLGSTWAAPGTIGSGTPSTGAFTTGSFTDAVTLTTASSGLTIAKTTGTTLVVSSTAASTTTTSGCATFAGGIGIAGAINVGGASCNFTSPSALLTLGDGTAAPTLAFNGAAGSVRGFGFNTAGSARWSFRAGTTAESGSDAGTQFEIVARNDSGTSIDVPITIIRAATGAITITRQLIGSASTTARATLRVPHGTAPSSPVNGDMWTTTAGLFVYINGGTVGPLT